MDPISFSTLSLGMMDYLRELILIKEFMHPSYIGQVHLQELHHQHHHLHRLNHRIHLLNLDLHLILLEECSHSLGIQKQHLECSMQLGELEYKDRGICQKSTSAQL